MGIVKISIGNVQAYIRITDITTFVQSDPGEYPQSGIRYGRFRHVPSTGKFFEAVIVTM